MRGAPASGVSAAATGPTAWRFPGGGLDLTAPRIMAILNVTPDSFSDGGLFDTVPAAVDRAAALVDAGADLLDVGGESTRPGAPTVDADAEAERVVPVVEALAARFPVPISVDTRKSAVAAAALDAGARVVNDVSALAHDPEMAGLVAERGVGVVLMHMRGEPATMSRHAAYDDVVAEVVAELGGAVERARAAGVDAGAIAVDPGLGFAKEAAHNLALLRHTDRLTALGYPVLVGPSRKRFLGEILDVPPRERGMGTAAACVLAYLGGARVFRVHDVTPTLHALRVAHAVAGAGAGPGAEVPGRTERSERREHADEGPPGGDPGRDGSIR